MTERSRIDIPVKSKEPRWDAAPSHVQAGPPGQGSGATDLGRCNLIAVDVSSASYMILATVTGLRLKWRVERWGRLVPDTSWRVG